MIILDMVKDDRYSADDIVGILVNFYVLMNPDRFNINGEKIDKYMGGLSSELGIDIKGLQEVNVGGEDKDNFIDYNIKMVATLLLARNSEDAQYR